MGDSGNTPSRDLAIRDLPQARLHVRPEITFRFEDFRGTPNCIIDDPTTGKFYRTGEREYHFIRLLDGSRTVGEAVSMLATKAKEDALNDVEAAGVIRWLIENDLVTTPEASRADLLFEKAGEKQKHKFRQFTNILFMKIPLFNPDRWVKQLEAPFHRWWGVPFFILWCCVITAGLLAVGLNNEKIVESSRGIIAPDNWFWLGATWLALKVLHELGHAISCRFHGGNVPEFGVFLVLFAPLTYVDATASWRFSNKWKRMSVGAAGIYTELFLGATAAIIWANTDQGTLNYVCFNIMVLTTVISFLFNANPLMRFDGYYLLSDFVEIPNLYGRSTHSLLVFCRKYLIGIDKLELPDMTDRTEWILLIYGIASFFWRIFIIVTLLIGATILLPEGIGFLLVCVSLLWWIYLPTVKFINYLRKGNSAEIPDSQVYGPRFGGIALGALIIAFLPFHATLTAPAISEFGDTEYIRVECAGFIKKIYVREGATVRKGDLLVKIENPEEQIRLRKLQAKLKQAESSAQMKLSQFDVVGSQIEMAKVQALQSQVKELKAFVDTLIMRSPINGKVSGRNFDLLEGTYQKTGTELMAIGNPTSHEVRIAVTENDQPFFSLHQGKPVKVKVFGRGNVMRGTLKRVDARATREVLHPALTALGGGPLSVQPIDTTQNDSNASYQLISPHFEAIVKIDPSEAVNLRSGERAYVKFTSTEGYFFWELVRNKISAILGHIIRSAEVTTL